MRVRVKNLKPSLDEIPCLEKKKHIKRVEDLWKNSKNSHIESNRLAAIQANKITYPDKAYGRGLVAQDLGYNLMADAFFNRWKALTYNRTDKLNELLDIFDEDSNEITTEYIDGIYYFHNIQEFSNITEVPEKSYAKSKIDGTEQFKGIKEYEILVLSNITIADPIYQEITEAAINFIGYYEILGYSVIVLSADSKILENYKNLGLKYAYNINKPLKEYINEQ